MEKKAPTGQYRVMGQDSPQDKGWRKGDFHTLKEAIEEADSRGHSTIRFSVYDDMGKCVHGKNGKIS